MKRIDPQGTRLPIKIDSTSNGEYPPIPVGDRNIEANRVALERATEHAKRLAVSRRRFLVSSAGAATTLLAFNDINAAAGKLGAYYDIPRDAALDDALAELGAEGQQFIFDAHAIRRSHRCVATGVQRAGYDHRRSYLGSTVF